MKKLLFIILSVVFISCSKDDLSEQNNQKVISSWNISSTLIGSWIENTTTSNKTIIDISSNDIVFKFGPTYDTENSISISKAKSLELISLGEALLNFSFTYIIEYIYQNKTYQWEYECTSCTLILLSQDKLQVKQKSVLKDGMSIAIDGIYIRQSY